VDEVIERDIFSSAARQNNKRRGKWGRIDRFFRYKWWFNVPFIFLLLGIWIAAGFVWSILAVALLIAFDTATLVPLYKWNLRETSTSPFYLSLGLSYIICCLSIWLTNYFLGNAIIFPVLLMLTEALVIQSRRSLWSLFGLFILTQAIFWGLEISHLTASGFPEYHLHRLRFSVPVYALGLFAIAFVVDVYLKAMKDERKQAGRLATEIDDIDASLRSAESRFDVLFESSPEPLMLLDESGRVLSLNQSAVEILGEDRLLIEGKRVADLLEPLMSEPAQLQNALKNVSEGGPQQQTPVNITLTSTDGSSKTVDLIFISVYFQDLGEPGTMVIGRDMTENIKLREKLFSYNKQLEQAVSEKTAALDRSEKAYVDLYNNIDDIIFTLDREGYFTDINPSLLGRLNLEPSRVVGKNIYEFATEQGKAVTEGIFEKSLTGVASEGEVQLAIPEIGSITLHVKSMPLYRGDEIIGVQGIARDVTERRLMEDELHRSKEMMESIFQNAQVGLFRASYPEGRVVECNQKMSEIFGFERRDDFIERILFSESFMDREIREVIGEQIEREGSISSFEACLRKWDGSPVWVMMSVQKLDSYLQGVVNDVTARKRAETAMAESETYLREMLDQSPDGILRTTPEGPVLDLNPSALEMFGYSPQDREKLRGKIDIKDHWAFPDKRADFIATVERDGYVRNHEIEFRRVDGSTFTCLVTTFPHRSSTGEIIEYQNFIKDISERKSLEEALRMQSEMLEVEVERRTYQVIAREKQIAEILDRSPDAVYEHDLQGNIFYFNKRVTEITGLSQSMLKGKGALNIIDLLNIKQDYQPILNRLTKDRRVRNAAVRILARDGKEVLLEVNADLIDDASGIRVRGTARDVTERVKLELQRTQAEERYRELFMGASDAVFTLDELGTFTAANPSVLDIIGYSSEELIGSRFSDLSLFDDENKELIDKWFKKIGDGERGKPIEVSLRRKDGSYRYLEIQSTPSFEDDRFKGMQGIGRDITERKSLELQRDRLLEELEQRVIERTIELQQATSELRAKNEEVSEKYSELQELHHTLERANEQLRSLDKMKTSLLQNVSHELRTPLVAIKGYSELLLAEKFAPLEDKQKSFLKTVLKNSNQLIRLISDLLDFSRLEQGVEQLELEPYDLRVIIGQSLGNNVLRALDAGVDMIRPEMDAPVMVACDAGRMMQIFDNLLSNAIKFSKPRGGKIEVKVAMDEESVEISVIDEGIGIAPEVIGKIFERFYQVDGSSTRSHGGTGIGLAITHELVLMHGGEIAVDSKLGEGSVFNVRFKLCLENPNDSGDDSTTTA
jgi:PAS domain S-box-containing protein